MQSQPKGLQYSDGSESTYTSKVGQKMAGALTKHGVLECCPMTSCSMRPLVAKKNLIYNRHV